MNNSRTTSSWFSLFTHLCFAVGLASTSLLLIPSTGKALSGSVCEVLFDEATLVSSTKIPVADLPRWHHLLNSLTALDVQPADSPGRPISSSLKRFEAVLQANPAIMLGLYAESQDPDTRRQLIANLNGTDSFLGVTGDSEAVLIAKQWAPGTLSFENLEQVQNLGRTSFFSGTKYRQLGAAPFFLERSVQTYEKATNLQSSPYLKTEMIQSSLDGQPKVRIFFPDVRIVTDFQIQLVSRVDNSLAQLLAESMTQGPENLNPKIQTKFLQALTRERLTRFTDDLAAAGQDQSAVYRAVATLLKDLNAIRPFDDPQNIFVRHLAHILLLSLDLPPPRGQAAIDQFITMSANEAGTALMESSFITAQLAEDLIMRSSEGLKTLNSPWAYLPSRIPSIEIDIKYQGNPKSFGKKNFSPEPEQWLAFVATSLSSDPNLKYQFKQDPDGFLFTSIERFREFSEKYNVEFHHEKEGARTIGLRFADADYLDKMFQTKSNDPLNWHRLMSRWYQPELIWRGHGYRHNAITDSDILNLFRQADMQLAANPVISGGRQGRDIKVLGLQEIAHYNASLLNGKVFQVSEDHHQMGSGYQESYGFSTSKSYDVARAFALGAMKVAAYGQQDAAQDLVKTRLAVGIKRARHYIEMGRLKPLNSDFSYIYGRQQEVMGIGIADPDSVMIAKELAPDKAVLKTFFRPEEIPSEVVVVSGDYNPGDILTEERGAKSFNLKTGVERPYVTPNVAQMANVQATDPANLPPSSSQVVTPGYSQPIQNPPPPESGIKAKLKKFLSHF